jgi:hypothetical protein
MKRATRVRVQLSATLDKGLSAYAIAAGAAGIGLLAAAQCAEAKIIYTKAHINIPLGTTNLYLTRDGHADFSFINTNKAGQFKALWLGHPPNYTSMGNWVVGKTASSGNYKFVSALAAGVSVNKSQQFLHSNLSAMAEGVGDGCSHGQWQNVRGRYMGLVFRIDSKGKYHYGWVRLNVTCEVGKPIHATITGYAYETVANKGIITGKTKGPDVVTMPADMGTLGRLALGRK